jgi:hypothetical protein
MGEKTDDLNSINARTAWDRAATRLRNRAGLASSARSVLRSPGVGAGRGRLGASGVARCRAGRGRRAVALGAGGVERRGRLHRVATGRSAGAVLRALGSWWLCVEQRGRAEEREEQRRERKGGERGAESGGGCAGWCATSEQKKRKVPSGRKEMGPTCHTLDESRREKKTNTKKGKCSGKPGRGFRWPFFISIFSIFNNRLYIFQKFRIKISILLAYLKYILF